MLTVAEALTLVEANVRPLPSRGAALSEAVGCALAEEIVSDVDSPPHDKSIVDGYAICFDDLVGGRAELRVVEEVTAGEVPRHTVERGTATRIMTGAPLPTGADAVVMVERTELVGPELVRLQEPAAKRGQNIVRRGVSMRRGERVLRPEQGRPLTPSHIGLLAEVGRTEVCVVPRPTIAVLATGNELVPAFALPGSGQIRNSNGPMLAAFVRRAGAEARDLEIARDERDDLRRKITAGLEFDALALSGGVSAGVLDLAPGVLRELGVREVFHKVSVKPGKPIWFGIFTAADGRMKPVFGLPGNPVSSLVCFELFVRPAVAVLRGLDAAHGSQSFRAVLTAPFAHRGNRPTFWPSKIVAVEAGESRVAPCAWRGSGDLRALADADCFICFPAGDCEYAERDRVEVRLIG